MGITEEEVLEVLREVFPQIHPDLILGIGDDAAIFTGRPGQVITTDIAVEGVHFKREWSSWRSIGSRVIAANIADLLSMNAKPQFLLVTLTLTGYESRHDIYQLAQGIAQEATRTGTVVIGGDTSRSATLSLSVTAIGVSEKPIRRSGARVGDRIYLSSLTGWSAAGLHLFSSGISINSANAEKAINEYQSPTLDYGIDFSTATSMCDVSDAIVIQGAQMASSSGLRFEIDLSLIKNAPEFLELALLAASINEDPVQWILSGGEDHVLLATGRDLPGIDIGKVVEGAGMAIVENGVEIKMAPVAWDHFRKN